MLDTCAETARRAGHVPRAERLAPTRRMLTEACATFTASMLRDVEADNHT